MDLEEELEGLRGQGAVLADDLAYLRGNKKGQRSGAQINAPAPCL
jgi:hypothetical protein